MHDRRRRSTVARRMHRPGRRAERQCAGAATGQARRSRSLRRPMVRIRALRKPLRTGMRRRDGRLCEAGGRPHRRAQQLPRRRSERPGAELRRAGENRRRQRRRETEGVVLRAVLLRRLLGARSRRRLLMVDRRRAVGPVPVDPHTQREAFCRRGRGADRTRPHARLRHEDVAPHRALGRPREVGSGRRHTQAACTRPIEAHGGRVPTGLRPGSRRATAGASR
ncbi:hypothetical protein BVI2075_780056 [Burkholderia vietnamiensis]|nr:hypothetical protein BVI2075_780056 [Burkholderia vietnamiensis]